MLINGINDVHLKYFISGSRELSNYGAAFDIDYTDINKRFSCAQELVKKNPKLLGGVVTSILDFIVGIGLYLCDAHDAKNLYNRHVASLAKAALDAQPADETDDEEDEVSEPGSPVSRVSPVAFEEEVEGQNRAPAINFSNVPFPSLPSRVESSAPVAALRARIPEEPAFRAPSMNFAPTIFSNFPSGVVEGR